MKKLYLALILMYTVFITVCYVPLCAQPTSTATANVQILSASFHIPQLNRDRRIWIYLPPDYDTTTKHYPVLYMHDAQNLFDDTLAFGNTEWGVDESPNFLFSAGDRGCILVGIENSAQRINEYSPWVNSVVTNTAEGDAYMQFIINTLKPYVDANYRTLTDRLHTGLAGSSMGGLISLYGAIRYPQVFAKAGVLSPSISFSEGEVDNLINQYGKQDHMRIFLYAGTSEPGTVVTDLNTTFDVMVGKGFDTSDIIKKITPGGMYNETAWGQVFPACYQWLMMNEENVTAVKELPASVQMSLFPNPAGDVVTISFDETKTGSAVHVSDLAGRKILMSNIEHRIMNIETSDFAAGVYFVTVGNTTKKLIIQH